VRNRREGRRAETTEFDLQPGLRNAIFRCDIPFLFSDDDIVTTLIDRAKFNELIGIILSRWPAVIHDNG
jgi:hypothetical protein